MLVEKLTAAEHAQHLVQANTGASSPVNYKGSKELNALRKLVNDTIDALRNREQ